jgi:hypothetical protein
VVANVPHQLYHQADVGVLPASTDRVLQSLALGVVSLAAILVTVLAFRLPPAQRIASPDSSNTARRR